MLRNLAAALLMGCVILMTGCDEAERRSGDTSAKPEAIAESPAPDEGSAIYPIVEDAVFVGHSYTPQDGKWGFIDASGEVVVAPRFDGIYPMWGARVGWQQSRMHNRYAVNIGGTSSRDAVIDLLAKTTGGKWGFIDRSGTMVIEPQFDMVLYFQENLAPVNVGGEVRRWHISGEGHRVPLELFDGGKWGYVDRQGNVAIGPIYDRAFWFSEGLAHVNVGGRVEQASPKRLPDFTGGKWGYIDKTGKIVIEPQFAQAQAFSNGLAVVGVTQEDGSMLYGYIDKTGQWAIEPQFEEAQDFSEGLAAVQRDGLSDYIDKTGKTVIDCNAGLAWPFSEGFGAVSMANLEGSNARCGYVNPDPSLTIPVQAAVCFPFSEGLGAFQTKEKTGIIDHSGQIIVEPHYEIIGYFHEGLALVFEEEAWGYIGRRGEWVYRAEIEREPPPSAAEDAEEPRNIAGE